MSHLRARERMGLMKMWWKLTGKKPSERAFLFYFLFTFAFIRPSLS